MPQAYFGTVAHSVVAGDTLYGIARKYNSTVHNILKFNTIPNPGMIRVGQVVTVPLSPPEALIYTVKSGDSVYSIAKRFGTSMSNIEKYNYLSPPFTIHPGDQLAVTASLR